MPEFDIVKWMQHPQTPREKERSARSAVVAGLLEGLRLRAGELRAGSRSLYQFKIPNGEKWPGKGKVVAGKPQDVSAEVFTRSSSGMRFERTDPKTVFFTDQYTPDRNGIVSRIYIEVGYTTYGGRRIVLKKGVWDQGRNAFKALADAIDKGPRAALQKEADALSAELSQIMDEFQTSRAAALRKGAIRLAATFPEGSPERRQLLAMVSMPSAFGIGDPVFVVLQGRKVAGWVRAITFTNAKVRYAVSCPVGEGRNASDDHTTLHNLDSVLVTAREGVRMEWTEADNYS